VSKEGSMAVQTRLERKGMLRVPPVIRLAERPVETADARAERLFTSRARAVAPGAVLTAQGRYRAAGVDLVLRLSGHVLPAGIGVDSELLARKLRAAVRQHPPYVAVLLETPVCAAVDGALRCLASHAAELAQGHSLVVAGPREVRIACLEELPGDRDPYMELFRRLAIATEAASVVSSL
jgi:hypothetical protein